MAAKKRPIGVTIIAILIIISGIGSLVAAMYLVINFTFHSIGYPSEIIRLLISFGYILTAFAIMNFLVARGLLKGKEWARIMTIILVIVSLILGIIGIALLVVEDDIAEISAVDVASFIIAGVIIWYLFRTNVKAYFGKNLGVIIFL
ncbi:MAG TPA: hypothetical protein VFM20_03705 [Nitrososphaeraceae archaeon]|nr:hypothetical protein [Nitrososphaeraceae archaeon]